MPGPLHVTRHVSRLYFSWSRLLVSPPTHALKPCPSTDSGSRARSLSLSLRPALSLYAAPPGHELRRQ
eukprot:3217774-Rhodomonas_salina.1